MPGVKKHAVPASGLISLGSKGKRPAPGSSVGGIPKKAKSEFVEVSSSELVSRTEEAITKENWSTAESLVLSALNQLRVNGILAASASTTGPRTAATAAASASKLVPGFSVGLLVLARSHPTLFARPDVLDQLLTLLASTPRDTSISVSTTSTATIAARGKGLHVLIANLIYFALESRQNWPSQLVKIYLTDSLTDRIWVDQDECRLFVLNLESAFTKAFGDPRGLFTVLSSHTGSSTSSSFSGITAPNAVYSVLGLSAPAPSKSQANISADEIADAVSTTLHSQPSSVARIIHGPALLNSVVPRFEDSRQAVEVIIASNLREALNRRISGGVLPSSAVSPALATTPGGGMITGGGTGAGSGDAMQLRSLIRTVAMAVGLSEVRSIAASRLEPWLTNPKVQIFAVALLALLATNCRLCGVSPYDLDLIVSIVCRIRYKLLKPNIQTAYFECICHLIKADPTNMYAIINLCSAWELRPQLNTDVIESKSQANQYIQQVIIGIADAIRSSTETTNESVSKHTQDLLESLAANSAHAVSRASNSAFILLPLLYNRYPTQWIRVVGTLLHERLLHFTNSISPLQASSIPTDVQVSSEVFTGLNSVYQYLRELAKNWKSALPELTTSLSTPTSGSNHSAHLPCAELVGALLHDRNNRGNLSVTETAASIVASIVRNVKAYQTKGHIAIFQLYLNGLVSLVNALQMLSTYRPNLCSSNRKSAQYYDALRAHQLALRQIRLGFIRWAKTILPSIVNAAIKSIPTDPEEDVNVAVLACFDALRPSQLIRRAFMLQSTHPIQNPESSFYELPSEYFPVRSIWPNDSERSAMAKLVMNVCLPEKLAHQLLILGLEPSWQLLSPLDAVDIVCDLVWRAAFLAHESGLETLTINKPEQLIDLLYTSCNYVSEQPLPTELAELAHSSFYWKVSFTAVVLAANCMKTCGLHLWNNYPTVRHLMEMAITRNFPASSATRPNLSDELDRLNTEMETQLVLQLETRLLNANSESEPDSQTTVTKETSKLLGRLVRNNPRGPRRLPPDEQLSALKFLCDKLSLDRLLSQSRDPDFLLEIIRTNASRATVQPWLISLVESSGTEFGHLPVQAFCEYLYCTTILQLQSKKREALPMAANFATPRGETSSNLNKKHVLPSDSNLETCKEQLMKRVLEELHTFSHQTAVDALTVSFLSRLADTRLLVRQAVRHCLQQLIKPDPPTASSTAWLNVLEGLMELPAFCTHAPSSEDSFVHQLNDESLHTILSAVISSIMVETDLNVLTACFLFLHRLTTKAWFTAWRYVIFGVVQFILTRESMLFRLIYRMSPNDNTVDTDLISLETLCGLFVRYVDYNCTAAEAIPIDENKSVFAIWSSDRQCPIELDCVRAQLVLLGYFHADLPSTRPSAVSELLGDTSSATQSCSWLVLRDLWCVKTDFDVYRLPDMSLFAFPMNAITEADCLSFNVTGAADTKPRASLSQLFRIRFLLTNQLPLVSAALFECPPEELINIVSVVDLVSFSRATLENLLQHLISIAPSHPEVGMLVDRVTERLNAVNQSTEFLPTPMETSEFSESQQPSEEPPHVLFSYNESHNFWSQLVVQLNALDDIAKCEVINDALSIASRDANAVQSWLAQLDQELSILERILRVRKTEADGRGSDFWTTLAQNRSIISTLEPLLLVCGSFESPQQKSNTFCVSAHIHQLLQNTSPLGEFRAVLLNIASTFSCTPHSDSLDPGATNTVDQSLILKETHLDSVCQFGLAEFAYLMPNSIDHSSFRGVDLVYEVVFNRSCSRTNKARGNYLLAELLSQMDPSFLLNCVRYLLSKNATQLSSIDSTRVLDFLRAVLTLPRLTYPVPLAESRNRPDSFTPLVNMIQLSVDESRTLCAYVLDEARQFRTSDQYDDSLLDTNLIKRLALLDLALTRWPDDCVQYLQQLISASDTILSLLAQRLWILLSLRWPSLSLGSLQTSAIRFCEPNAMIARSKKSAPQFEIDRIGPLISVGITSADDTIANLARSTGIALATHHPRLFLRLLPLLAGLSEGYLDLTWSKFCSRKYHLLFIYILHLLEILNESTWENNHKSPCNIEDHPVLFGYEAWPYRTAIDHLFKNFIQMLSTFHSFSRRLHNFPSRLARLLESYLLHAVWPLDSASDASDTLLHPDSAVWDQIRSLSTHFDEFGCILEMMLVYTSQRDNRTAATLPLSTSSINKSGGKRVTTAWLSPILQQIQPNSDPKSLLTALKRLDNAFQKRPEILSYFKSELERLLTHTDENVVSTSMELIMKLAKHRPLMATDIIETGVLPLFSLKLGPVSIPSDAIISALPDLCVLAPHMAPRLLNACTQSVLFTALDKNGRLLIDSIGESVRRLSLDSLNSGGIEFTPSCIDGRKK